MSHKVIDFPAVSALQVARRDLAETAQRFTRVIADAETVAEAWALYEEVRAMERLLAKLTDHAMRRLNVLQAEPLVRLKTFLAEGE